MDKNTVIDNIKHIPQFCDGFLFAPKINVYDNLGLKRIISDNIEFEKIKFISSDVEYDIISINNKYYKKFTSTFIKNDIDYECFNFRNKLTKLGYKIITHCFLDIKKQYTDKFKEARYFSIIYLNPQ